MYEQVLPEYVRAISVWQVGGIEKTTTLVFHASVCMCLRLKTNIPRSQCALT